MKSKTITVKIIRAVRPRRWICFGEDIGWTGPSFRTRKSAREWAVKTGYLVDGL